jgi:hypothetical protein
MSESKCVLLFKEICYTHYKNNINNFSKKENEMYINIVKNIIDEIIKNLYKYNESKLDFTKDIINEEFIKIINIVRALAKCTIAFDVYCKELESILSKKIETLIDDGVIKSNMYAEINMIVEMIFHISGHTMKRFYKIMC